MGARGSSRWSALGNSLTAAPRGFTVAQFHRKSGVLFSAEGWRQEAPRTFDGGLLRVSRRFESVACGSPVMLVRSQKAMISKRGECGVGRSVFAS